MTDVQDQIEDIKEQIDIKKMEISVLEKKLLRLEKSLSKGDKTTSAQTDTTSSEDKGKWTALGKLLDKSKVSLNTGENIAAGYSQVQSSQEHQGIQSPIQPLVGINTSSAGTKFYVIFDGPHKGFYSNWTEVETLVKNKPYKHKSFKTYTEAQNAFLENCKTKGIDPEPHKQIFDLPIFRPNYQQMDIRSRPRLPAQLFKPPSKHSRLRLFSYKETAQSSTTKIHDRFTSLGKILKPKEENTIPDIPLMEFLTLEAEARVIGDSAPEETYYGTLDKKYGQFVFLEGADPIMVQSAFHCGLIKMVIPGDDLNELSLIDEGLFQSIKDFKTFVIKNQQTRLIIKFNSTIPIWDKNKILFKGYHHVQIRTVQEILLDRPVEGEPCETNDIILQEWRSLSFQRLLTSLNAFNRDSKVKVNHSSKFILMTSRTSATISIDGIKTICRFEQRFYNLINAPASYNGHLCKSLKSSLGKNHACQFCQTDKTSLKEKDSSSSDKEKDTNMADKAFTDSD
ncbi:Uncharacterized protein Adt_31244 [Abeliophyllum distichum]|uniref:Ribonuclease H1 N-terminal domain-containing protein n=1 Tax=Abeliophyllum distichum TaxID=126358 RepID=A0ABD1RFB2_9LAMI